MGSKKSGKHRLGLRIIALGKLLKVLTLIGVGIAALATVGHDPPHVLRHVANGLGFAPGNHMLQELAAKAAGLSKRGLLEIALGSFVYASLFAVEGIGLWLEKRWGEYFTIVITLSFIPLEIYEIVKHPNAPKVVTLVLNVAALVYLLVRVMKDRKPSRSPTLGRLGIASH